ncbi:MAG: cryptochrome/photolyase family protein [Alphaproteobacteria bacterium]|nr:cryptochrome/photolyase family protein [Alphaproteobacteria bacterium]
MCAFARNAANAPVSAHRKPPMSELVLLLGDQLSPDISSLKAAPNAPVLMAELADEANYVRHHKQKIALVFAAMRHFARQLAEKGRETIYHQYDAQAAIRSFADAVAAEIDRRGVTQLFVTEPGEYRLLAEMRQWAARFGIEVDILPDTRFIASHADFDEVLDGLRVGGDSHTTFPSPGFFHSRYSARRASSLACVSFAPPLQL